MLILIELKKITVISPLLLICCYVQAQDTVKKNINVTSANTTSLRVRLAAIWEDVINSDTIVDDSLINELIEVASDTTIYSTYREDAIYTLAKSNSLKAYRFLLRNIEWFFPRPEYISDADPQREYPCAFSLLKNGDKNLLKIALINHLHEKRTRKELRVLYYELTGHFLGINFDWNILLENYKEDIIIKQKYWGQNIRMLNKIQEEY